MCEIIWRREYSVTRPREFSERGMKRRVKAWKGNLGVELNLVGRNSKGWYIHSLVFSKLKIKIYWKMKAWDGIQSSLSSRSNATLGNQASSRTVRLGRVQPQAPTHRTIFCNDREANFPIRFKVANPILLRFRYLFSSSDLLTSSISSSFLFLMFWFVF